MQHEAARTLRWRLFARRACIGSFVAGIVIWCVGAFLLKGNLEPLREFVFPAFALAWLGALVSGAYLHAARCPSCGKRFASRGAGLGYRYNDFTSKCMNCGLELKRAGR